MIDQLYHTSLAMLITTSAIFGLLFLTQHESKRPKLYNYRLAKRLITVAFLCVAIGKSYELAHHISDPTDASTITDILFSKGITLIVAVFQAFAFTLSFLLLLGPDVADKKKAQLYFVVPSIFIISIIVSFVLFSYSTIEKLLYAHTLIYLFILVWFTSIFTSHYKRFKNKMDNFYSDDSAKRLRWIAIAFYLALAVGVLALVTVYFFTPLIGIIFIAIAVSFYTFLGIEILNYPWQFSIIESTIEEKKPITGESTSQVSRINIVLLQRWIDERQFVTHSININDVAQYLGTNRSYFSEYINNTKNITFRQWINGLRIEEAKNIIKQKPDITLNELAEMSGYASARNLIRQFQQQTGETPTSWKDKNREN